MKFLLALMILTASLTGCPDPLGGAVAIQKEQLRADFEQANVEMRKLQQQLDAAYSRAEVAGVSSAGSSLRVGGD